MKCSSAYASLLKLPILGVALALACALSFGVAPAHAVTAAEVEAQANEALVQLNAMQETLDQISAEYFQALSDYGTAIQQRDEAKAQVDELNAEIANLQDRLGTRARDMYRGGSATVVDLLLGSASFEEFTTSWDLLNRLNENDATMTARTRELRVQVEAQQAEYQRQADVAEKKSEEAAKAYAEAETLVQQMQETYDNLSAEAQALYAAEAQAAYEAQMAAQSGGGVVNDDGTVTDMATGEVYSSASEYTAATGNAVVDRARAMLGSDYVWGGVGGSWGGFDCSGLVSYALTGENVRLGTTATFANWNQVSDPQPGDVCVIHEEDGNQHTGIYVGDGRMIHASTYGVGVIESNVQDGMIYVRP